MTGRVRLPQLASLSFRPVIGGNQKKTELLWPARDKDGNW